MDTSVFRVSWFDTVSSWLMALMLFIGRFVVMLVVVWLIDSEPPSDFPLAQQVRPVSHASVETREFDFLEPGAIEVEQLAEVSLNEMLLAVSESASRVAAAWVASPSDGRFEIEGESGGRDRSGDSRVPVSPIDGVDGVPAFERWQLKFSAVGFESYARQLDFFGIELGVIGGSIQGIDYLRDVSTRPTVRRGASESEQRLYFLWNQPGPLMHYDRRLLSRAGVELQGREMLKFIPAELKKRLTETELEYARSVGHGSISEIAKTIFESRPAGSG